MSVVDILLDIEAAVIVLDKYIALCNPEEKERVLKAWAEEEREDIFLIPVEFCEKGKIIAVTDTRLARVLVTNELQKQRKEKGD